jgi:hypothetical protein
MKQSTKNAFDRAYVVLLRLVEDLYEEVGRAIDNEDYADASLLEARAEILFEQAEAISTILQEQTNG